MKDDYLWDGSGEPDPEIERLEQVLGKYRYQAKPLSPAFDQHFVPRRVQWWPRLAVAAAIILMVLAGIWIVRNQQDGATRQEMAQEQKPAEQPQQGPAKNDNDLKPVTPQPRESVIKNAVAVTNRKPAARRASPFVAKNVEPKSIEPNRIEPERVESATGGSEVATMQPMVIPFVDVETAKHIEKSQMLLRSFRNAGDARNASSLDVAYEKERSKELLTQNIVLRRNAEAKGNMPVEDLLGSLEPFLLDIANLPEKPSKTDVRSIKERMQKKEIVSALQIYSAPVLSQVF